MNRLYKNSVFNFSSQIAAFLSSLILSILLARILGPKEMGNYNYLMWLIGSVSLLLSLGFPTALTKFIAQYHSDSEVTKVKQIITRSFILENIILVIITGVLVDLSLFAKNEERTSYTVVALAIPVFVLNNIINGYFQGLQKYSLVLRMNLLIAPISLILSLIVLFFYRSLTNLLLLNLFIALMSLTISIYFLRDYLDFKIGKIPKNIHSEIFKYTLSISFIVLLDLVLMERSEVFFLKMFSGIEQVAFYSIAFGLVNRIMILIPGAISGVIMPRIARLHGAGENQLISETYFFSTRYLSLITIPLIFAGIVLIDMLIKILYGNSYLLVGSIIKILLISGGLSAIVAAASSVLYGIGKQSFILRLGVLAAFLNIILDVFLIPGFGAIGAAFANSLAQIFGVICGTYYIVKVKKLKFPLIPVLKLTVVGLISAIAIWLLGQLNIFNLISDIFSLGVLGVLYFVFYIGGLFLVSFFEKKDFDISEGIIQKMPFSLLRVNLVKLHLNLRKRFVYEKSN